MATQQPPRWTIMVYLAGDNNLTSYCISLLQQLEAATYRDEICVLACFDSSIPWPKGSRYFRINCRHVEVEKEIDWEMHNDLIQANGDGNERADNVFTRPSVAEGLTRFIEWAMKEHGEDTDRYMLVLFGHGPAVTGQNFLVSENPQSFLRIEDLRDILDVHFNGKRKLDILAFQNCVMNNIEVAYELKDQADLTIGSQGLVLASGWPYERLIGTLVQHPEAKPNDIAREMLKICARNMVDFSVMDRSSEQAVCDLKELRDSSITAEIAGLVALLMHGMSFRKEDHRLRFPAIVDAVRLARLDAQAFWSENFVDLYDFCGRLLKKCNQMVRAHGQLLNELGINKDYERELRETDLIRLAREIIDRCKDIRETVTRLVPHSYFIGSDLQYSHGLSIYFPWSEPGAPYVSTRQENGEFRLNTAFEAYQEGFRRFVEVSGWAKFLNSFFTATLRNVRRTDRSFVPVNAGASLGEGVVTEDYQPQSEFLTGPEIKSSPDTGSTGDIWTSVKNYPRRGYLSPADEARKVTRTTYLKEGMEGYDPKNPPVSSWGWNIQGLVAEAIRKEKKELPERSGKAAESKAASAGDSPMPTGYQR